MVDPRQPRSPGGLSVGGPGGIRIEGTVIEAGHQELVAPTPPQLHAGAPPLVPVVAGPPDVASLVRRHRKGLAAAMGAGSLLVFAGAGAMIAAIGLPWVLFAPAAVGAAMLGVAALVVARGGGRAAAEGVDPALERALLDLATRSRGRVTVTAAAQALRVTLAEAEAGLTALARSGHVAVENDLETGVVIYVFPEIEFGLRAQSDPHARRNRP